MIQFPFLNNNSLSYNSGNVKQISLQFSGILSPLINIQELHSYIFLCHYSFFLTTFHIPLILLISLPITLTIRRFNLRGSRIYPPQVSVIYQIIPPLKDPDCTPHKTAVVESNLQHILGFPGLGYCQAGRMKLM